jgi:phosphoribosylanthranilate isomerase
MTWVKICGMTNLEDALVAVDAGADAVGFVFYEKSPRCVTVEQAREICEKLPENVEKIGVFVGADSDPIAVLFRARLTGTQSYLTLEGLAGTQSASKATALSILPARARFMIAMSMAAFDDDLQQVQQIAEGFAKARKKAEGRSIPEGFFDTFLLDSGTSRQPGGTGKTFDWYRARDVSDAMRNNGLKMVVAGGLNPENVGDALGILRPWGVDVVSGVEASPGKKDPEKVRAFVRAVREMDGRAPLKGSQ